MNNNKELDTYDIVLTTPIVESQERFCKRQSPPISLLHLSAIISANKKNIKILDLSSLKDTEQAFRQRVKKLNSPVWGITCDVTDRFRAFKTADLIREIAPDSLVVLGGIFATQCYKTVMEDIKSVDIVVRGDGEYAISEILDTAENRDFNSIKGISWRRGDDIIHNEPRPMTEDLNLLPEIDYSLIDHSLYANDFANYGLSEKQYPSTECKSPVAFLMFSRGCPFNCIFCSSPNQGFLHYRIVSPARAVKQIEYFYEHNYRSFIFWDDHLLLNKRWFNEFCDLILQKNLKFYCKMSSRIDSVTEENVKKLKQIGCVKLTLGIEYGETNMLKFIGKGITTEQVENVCALLHKYDILAGGGMMTNFPRETFEVMDISFKFFKRMQKYGLNANLFPSPVQVHPGTVLDREYWRRKYPDFRWTKNFFCKRNLYMKVSPYIPLWENIPTPELLRQIIIASFLNDSAETILFIIHEFLMKPDSIYLNLIDRFSLRIFVLMVIIKGFFRNPVMLIRISQKVVLKLISKLKKNIGSV